MHKQSKRDCNNDELKIKYLSYRNALNKLIKSLKLNFYRQLLEKHKGNVKETWNTIKEIYNLVKKNELSSDLLKHSNITDSLDEVNRFFTTIGSNLANETLSKLNTTDSLLALNAQCTDPPANSMSLYLTDPGEVADVISGLKTTSNLHIHSYPCNRQISTNTSCICPILERVSNIKYLGINIDDRLSWKIHITSVAKRLRKLMYVFKELRAVCDKTLPIQTYKALGECIITYCITSWGAAAKTHILELERAQRSLLCLPFRHPTTAVYEMVDVLTVRQLFIFLCIKRYHATVVPYLPASDARRQRFPAPSARSRIAQQHFNFHAPRLYKYFNTNRASRRPDAQTRAHKALLLVKCACSLCRLIAEQSLAEAGRANSCTQSSTASKVRVFTVSSHCRTEPRGGRTRKLVHTKFYC
ncbi:Uncharacterized protein OBRU01_23934 [Operophtera brumata]|uniref:RNA-directed DNA polymerase from mobile element jockey n=1 Tax=Operophtera brumata TaxID=104452 RepID=A0A0L7K4E1_OPEBR|nr:Uncharacterized protein OBRU01_23934 [Operophtera brumata]